MRDRPVRTERGLGLCWPAVRVRFGQHVFDDGVRQLTWQGAAVPLAPKAFDLLAALIEQRPRVVSRADLQDRLWPDTFVAYTSLARLVADLRRALADDHSEPRFIRTVPGFGYAFCAAADDEREARAGARFPCSLLWGRRVIGLAEGDNVVGRSPACAVHIDSPRISRFHARIAVQGREATIEDLKSKNGTYVDGRRLGGPVALADGHTIAVGGAALIFRQGDGERTTEA